MSKRISVKCPAKINLDLRVFKKDEITGFHPIKSIMQAINLFDYLEIIVNSASCKEIKLKGNTDEIPYDAANLCYKAADLFLTEADKTASIEINIKKNIPVAAGLAGGSTDGAGVLFGLNKIFNNVFKEEQLLNLASKLGSDVAFCLSGGTKLCTGRGEKMTPMPFYNFKLSLIKPKNLKISAKEAYDAFDKLNCDSNMRNDLEFALLNLKKYDELEYLTSLGFQMSGSGPTYFLRDKNIDIKDDRFIIFNNLNSIPHGSIEA